MRVPRGRVSGKHWKREFRLRGIPFERQVELVIYYKGDPLSCTYRADFICYEDVIV